MAEIRHRLGLALRVVDAATGKPPGGGALALKRDGVPVHPVDKGEGGLAILDGLREDFDLTVTAPGYEPLTHRVSYAALDQRLPFLELCLIPGKDYRAPFPCLTLEGTLPGITALDAVRAGESHCLIRALDPRRRLMTIFNPHGLELNRTWYALVNPDAGTYELFSILHRVSNQSLKLDRPLDVPFQDHFPICPVVFGGVGPGDSYRLRVRDDHREGRWLVRWQQNGRLCFKTVDFHDTEPPSLP